MNALHEMTLKVQSIGPELVLIVTAFVVMIVGLSPNATVRRSTGPLTALALILSMVLAATSGALGVTVAPMAVYIKVAVAAVGLLLLLAAVELPTDGDAKRFDVANTLGGEFFGFFLLSLAGAMLCAGADDLIWLFLALELTSLPTYVMVAVSRSSLRAPEAAVKYFFLGAMSAAMFLYGFALLYGATGSTYLSEIAATLATQSADGGLSGLAMTGLIITIIGLCFKIAAVPMHFYAADVYEGAAAPVTAFLAFVPKTAGFVALILILSLVGWPLNQNGDASGIALHEVIWWLAALTMFAGNTLALLQRSVKRVLAYSSVAHSGYMLAALVAGPGSGGNAPEAGDGVAAVLFYLVAYGVMNLGVFAVIGLLKRHGEEAETYDDLRGLSRRHPVLAASLAICALSLLGFPPLVGFWGKLFLVSSVLGAGETTLAIVLVVNSAIAAYYYLRLVAESYLPEVGEHPVEVSALPGRSLAAVAAALGVIALSVLATPLVHSGVEASAGLRRTMPSAGLHIVPADPQQAPVRLGEAGQAGRD